MSILLFTGFFILYTTIFGRHLKPDAPVVAPVLTAPPAPTHTRAAAKEAPPNRTLVVKEEVKQPVVVEDDPKPTKLVPLRKWATRHGVKGAAKMNTAQLKEAIARAGL